MRTRHRCPKCDHHEVLHVPEPRDSNQDRLAVGGVRRIWGNTVGELEAYICLKCGYVELYVRDIGAIDAANLEGARVLTAEAPSDPYR